MGEWTGKWKSTMKVKCQCKCGKKDGAEKWSETFDADHIDSLIHDGETKIHITYICDECAKKYGRYVEEYED